MIQTDATENIIRTHSWVVVC